MRFAMVRSEQGTSICAVRSDDSLVDIGASGFPHTMEECIFAGPAVWQAAMQLIDIAPTIGNLANAQVVSPLTVPSKIIAVGMNYADHVREIGAEIPKVPILFPKYPSTLVGDGAVVQWDEMLTRQVDYEVELAVVIGRKAYRVDAVDALDYVFGYTVANDLSARDLQFGDGQWTRGKNLDGFCPLGPVILTADSVPDPQQFALRCLVNGRMMQESSTSQMIFSVRELIAFISQFCTLNPGDLILTGTPFGVGMSRTPQVYLRPGDVVQSEIDGIGRLTTYCFHR